MNTESNIVLGIDGGGTHTRVIAANIKGNILAYAEKGGSSPSKNADAEENVKSAINEAISRAKRNPCDVKMIVAGLASLDSEKDLEWATKMTDIDGLDCPKLHVNDAVVAQYGAFAGAPGIIVISGTGSILFGANEAGSTIRNYDFHHYAASASRFLSYHTIYEIMAGNCDSSDAGLLNLIFNYWQVKDRMELCKLGSRGFCDDRRERDRLFGNMAPLVTEAALQGSAVAKTVCNQAIHEIVVGVELLATCFHSNTIPVAYIGSVVNSVYIQQSLTTALHDRSHKRFQVRGPMLSSAKGAVLMALNRLGETINDSIVVRLQQSGKAEAGSQ
jgi:glucosamine kinase